MAILPRFRRFFATVVAVGLSIGFGICGLTGLVAAFSVPAAAHAIIKDSTPAANATVVGPDILITLRFNSILDRQRSRLSLRLPDGTIRVLSIEPGKTPTDLTARAGSLALGSHRILWQVLSVDGHITRGEIPFKISGR
ncbi:hypothetical protein WCLP8_260009 [uncultured Gammaproteobacteria bacterium]